MSATKGWSSNAARLFVITYTWSALLLLSGCRCSAETTVITTPSSVDAANPQTVELRVRKADGSIDLEFMKNVASVKVGAQPATVQSRQDAAIIIVPPKLTSGTQPVQLFDANNNEIAQGELRYDGAADQLTGEERRRDNLAGYTWYYVLVSLMFGAVLIPFVVAIYRGTRVSETSTNRPLGLPVGSFRSILAYSLVAYMGFYVLTSILSVSKFAPPDFLMGIVATVIGFYFGSRSMEEGEASAKTGAVRGMVRQGGADPARGALVKFKRSADGTEPYSRISDVDGRFELRGVAPGKYKVSASLAGASSDEQEISVAEGSDHEIEIVLKSARPAPPPAAQTGTVQGTVKRTDGNPAAQASVVFSQGAVEKLTKKTDANGSFKADGVPAGEYEVKASLSPDKLSDPERVTVIAGGQYTVDLKLKS